MGRPGPTRRSFALAVLGAGSVWLAIRNLPGVFARFGPESEFRPLARPAGFRALVDAGARSAPIATLGIAPLNDAGPSLAEIPEGRALCAALFVPLPSASRPAAPPLAYFYDVQCPICRKMMPELERIAADMQLELRFHLLTGLGPASETAARAIIAARSQGLEAAFRSRLMRANFQTNRAYVATLAESVGADAGRLLAAMEAAEVSAELAQSAALARLFAIPGTPALIVGRSLAIGGMDGAAMRRLIAAERAEPLAPPCG